MMRTVAMARMLSVAVTLAGLGATARFLVMAPALAAAPEADAIAAPAPLAVRQRVDPGELATAIAERDVFRAARAPASVRFDAARGEQAASAPPQVARPPLVLTGILSGRDPAALLEGLPGVEGTRVLRTGERSGNYVIRSIRGDEVVVAGPDTAWTLRVRTRFP